MTTTSQKLCLNWKNFQQNISNVFRDLRSDNDLADVTLACEDGQTLSAHKVMLASSSPFFQEIFKTFQNPLPLIFVTGVRFEELSGILDFVYCGEAFVDTKNVNAFQKAAEYLKIDGLIKKSKENGGEGGDEGRGGGSEELGEEGDERDEEVEVEEVEVDIAEFDKKVKELTQTSKNYEQPLCRRKLKICKKCGLEGKAMTIMRHIEDKHFKGIFPCNLCTKTYPKRTSLREHMTIKHK